MRIKTSCICPPIPTRNYDWSAYDESRYSPCEDPSCECRTATGNIVGYGPTESEAIADLMSQLEERREA